MGTKMLIDKVMDRIAGLQPMKLAREDIQAALNNLDKSLPTPLAKNCLELLNNYINSRSSRGLSAREAVQDEVTVLVVIAPLYALAINKLDSTTNPNYIIANMKYEIEKFVKNEGLRAGLREEVKKFEQENAIGSSNTLGSSKEPEDNKKSDHGMTRHS